MEAFCIETATYAQKGVKLLTSHGISAAIRRSDCAGKGCAFEITVESSQSNAAYRLLVSGNIPIIKRHKG